MQKRIGILVISIIFSAMYSDAQVESIKLWPEKIPGQSAQQTAAVISDNNSRNVLRIAEVTMPLLEIYLPDTNKNLGKAIIVCPGGGYGILALDLEGREVATMLSEAGYHAFVLHYRVPKNREGAFQDAQRAIRTVRSLSQKFGFDNWQVGIMGFSAGGHLSARAATGYDELAYSPIDKIDTLDPRPDFSALIYPAYLDDSPDRKLSSDLSMDKDLPPFFIFGTADDGFGNDALVMAQALRDHKHPVELHLYNSGGHGYGLREGNPAADAWPALLKCWLAALE